MSAASGSFAGSAGRNAYSSSEYSASDESSCAEPANAAGDPWLLNSSSPTLAASYMHSAKLPLPLNGRQQACGPTCCEQAEPQQC